MKVMAQQLLQVIKSFDDIQSVTPERVQFFAFNLSIYHVGALDPLLIFLREKKMRKRDNSKY